MINMETENSTIGRKSEEETTSEVVPSSLSKLSQEILGIDYIAEPEKVYKQMYSDARKLGKKYEIPLCLDTNGDYRNRVESLIELVNCRGAKILYCNKDCLDKPYYYPGLSVISIPLIDLDNCTEWETFVWGCNLSHELVHHMQYMQTNIPIDKIPIELWEYEAFVVSHLVVAVGHAMAKASQWEEWERRVAVEYIFNVIEESSREYYEKIGVSSDQISWMRE